MRCDPTGTVFGKLGIIAEYVTDTAAHDLAQD